MRRRLSPHARSVRSTAAGRMPYRIWSSRAGSASISSSRSRSSGRGGGDPAASRIADRTSNGIAVRRATLGKGLVGEAREQRIGRVVDEPEPDDALPHALGDGLERHAGRAERLEDARTPHVALGKSIRGGREEAQVAQPVHECRVDPCAVRDLGSGVTHDLRLPRRGLWSRAGATDGG